MLCAVFRYQPRYFGGVPRFAVKVEILHQVFVPIHPSGGNVGKLKPFFVGSEAVSLLDLVN